MPGFVHLAVHTDFSLHDSLVSYDSLIAAAKADGAPAVAMTDASNLFGAVRFFKEALANGIKPILGAEINLATQEGVGRVILICRNNQGYENLMALLSDGFASHPQRENGGPVIPEETLARFGRGLVLIDAGRKGAVGRLLLEAGRQSGSRRDRSGR